MRCIVLNDRLFALTHEFLGILFWDRTIKALRLKNKMEFAKLIPAFGIPAFKLCLINGSVVPEEFRKFIFEHEKYEMESVASPAMPRRRAHDLATAKEYLEASRCGKLKEHHSFMIYCLERLSFCFPAFENAALEQKKLRWEIFLQFNSQTKSPD